MRRSFPRELASATFALVLAASALAPRPAHADRLDLTGFVARGIDRLNSIGADSLGLSYHNSLSGGMAMDFRVLDLPMGKGAAKPSLHVTGGVLTDELILGAAAPGQLVAVEPVIELSTGVAFELPLDAFLKGNAGVSMRIGWEGSDLLTRSGGDIFLTRSKARLDFVRTTGGLMGSQLGVGMGRDETFGYDAASNRWDVRGVVQARLVGVRAAAATAPPSRPGAPAPKAAAATSDDERLLWLFVDVDVDTAGGVMADGLRARAGLGIDLSEFVTNVFAVRGP
ncbi:MAG TPA: hypothetical protein VMI75_37815 [Polyangiaceae bacterium]|nr:hypothetical protein [Polyangiaceae bacterium]